MKMLDDSVRKESLLQFGFGTELMKTITICSKCKSMEDSESTVCSKCGAELPGGNLYDYYRKQHDSCPNCNTILSKHMNYCPKCGIAVKKAE